MKKELLRSVLLGVLLVVTCASRAEIGVTDRTITLGESAVFSGPAAALGEGMRDGALAYFEEVNANGGVHKRKIILEAMDDGYEPNRTVVNTRQLIQNDVFALFGYVGTPPSVAALPLINEAHIPFFAPFTGAEALREPFNKDVFHIRASYSDETESIVKNAVTLGKKRIAVLYQHDGFGDAGLQGVTRALQKRGMSLCGTASVERNSTDVTAAVSKIKTCNPDAVVLVSAYKSVAAFIRGMHEAGQEPWFWSVSFVGADDLVKELGPIEARGVMVSEVMPAPWDVINPVVAEYQRLYVKKGNHQASYESLEGFIAAKVFVEGLRRSGANPTREGFIQALESLSHYDVGGFQVDFGPEKHTGSKFLDVIVVSKTGQFWH